MSVTVAGPASRARAPEPAGDAATPAALRNFILKLTGFCNINCSYCYMFNSHDRGFEHKPKYMSAQVAVATLRGIEAYLRKAGADRAAIVLHGGEPSLWPPASFEAFFDELRRVRGTGLAIDVTMQTNLWRRPSKRLLQLFREHDASFGISLDGPRTVNDANRVTFTERGTYDRVIQNVRSLLDDGHGGLIGGFLSVMQPQVPPDDFLAWVCGLPVTRVNLLWPLEYNRANPPWGSDRKAAYAANPRYGAWAAAVFDAWWRLDRPDVEIKLFQDAVVTRLGAQRSGDMLGAVAFRSMVVNTDGELELSDYFRTSRDGGASTGLSVESHPIAAFVGDPRVARLRAAAQALPPRCRRCRHAGVCGGGTLSGRLNDDGEVTAGPSVLCHDHMRLFDAIAETLDGALAREPTAAG